MNFIVIAVGGAIGSVLRYIISGWVQSLTPYFPAGTMFVNLTGSFLFGVAAEMTGGMLFLPPSLRNLIFTGILGAFTTFSTFTWESFNLLEQGAYFLFWVNILGSLAGGIIFLIAGVISVRLIGGML